MNSPTPQILLSFYLFFNTFFLYYLVHLQNKAFFGLFITIIFLTPLIFKAIKKIDRDVILTNPFNKPSFPEIEDIYDSANRNKLNIAGIGFKLNDKKRLSQNRLIQKLKSRLYLIKIILGLSALNFSYFIINFQVYENNLTSTFITVAIFSPILTIYFLFPVWPTLIINLFYVFTLFCLSYNFTGIQSYLFFLLGAFCFFFGLNLNKNFRINKYKVSNREKSNKKIDKSFLLYFFLFIISFIFSNWAFKNKYHSFLDSMIHLLGQAKTRTFDYNNLEKKQIKLPPELLKLASMMQNKMINNEAALSQIENIFERNQNEFDELAKKLQSNPQAIDSKDLRRLQVIKQEQEYLQGLMKTIEKRNGSILNSQFKNMNFHMSSFEKRIQQTERYILSNKEVKQSVKDSMKMEQRLASPGEINQLKNTDQSLASPEEFSPMKNTDQSLTSQKEVKHLVKDSMKMEQRLASPEEINQLKNTDQSLASQEEVKQEVKHFKNIEKKEKFKESFEQAIREDKLKKNKKPIIDKRKESMLVKLKNNSLSLLQKLFKIFPLLSILFLAYFLYRIFNKKTYIDNEEIQISEELKKEIIRSIEEIKNYKNFIEEAKKKYTVFHQAIQRIYYENKMAPPPLILPTQESEIKIKALKEASMVMGSVFIKIEFGSIIDFSKSDKNSFRQHFKIFENFVKNS